MSVATHQTPQITEGFQVFQQNIGEKVAKTSLVQGLAGHCSFSTRGHSSAGIAWATANR